MDHPSLIIIIAASFTFIRDSTGDYAVTVIDCLRTMLIIRYSSFD